MFSVASQRRSRQDSDRLSRQSYFRFSCDVFNKINFDISLMTFIASTTSTIGRIEATEYLRALDIEIDLKACSKQQKSEEGEANKIRLSTFPAAELS